MKMNEMGAKVELGIVPDSRDVFKNGELKRFGNLVEQRIELKAMIKSAEDDIKVLDTKIMDLMSNHDCQKAKHGDYSVSLCQGSSSSLSKEKLLEAGVSATVIAQATSHRTYQYVLVSAPKAK